MKSVKYLSNIITTHISLLYKLFKKIQNKVKNINTK